MRMVRQRSKTSRSTSRPVKASPLSGALVRASQPSLIFSSGSFNRHQAKSSSTETPLNALPMEAWRKHLAYIPQNPTLFSGTIREAIRYGKPEADDAAV